MTADLRAAVVQDPDTRTVLMLGWMNPEAERLTRETGHVHFWSRSRNRLWRKGETSGNVLQFVDMTEDCDGDALLVSARPVGPTCHTGSSTCWTDDVDVGFGRLERLWRVIEARAEHRPEGSYTTRLLEAGPDLPGRKLVEEATEVLMAAKDDAAGVGTSARVAEEAADLIYHLLVLLQDRNVTPRQVFDILSSRA